MATTFDVLITGNTYPVKNALKALGGRWDADAKGWRVPSSQATKAKALVAGSASASKGTRTGCRCGSVEEYSKSTDCWSCRHDAD